jgi:hypothetical protein
MTSNNLPRIQRIFCNYCKGYTNHVLHGSHHKEVHNEDDTGWWEESDYRFWICAGCDSAVLEERYIDVSLSMVDEYEYRFFPKPKVNHVDGKYFLKLPSKLKRIYKEAIQAFNEELYILAAAGLRALIEGICSDKQIKGRNLEEKINRMNTLLPQNIVTNLHSFRFIGNDAVHELETPQAGDLRLAIGVSEDLLNFLYELDYKSSQLPKAKNREQPNVG